tara:strand:- start:7266 stop:7415 length:150 start_codon:yes stop_codon:yes gene_type:complete
MKILNKIEYKKIKGGFNFIDLILKGFKNYGEIVIHWNKLRKTQVILVPL